MGASLAADRAHAQRLRDAAPDRVVIRRVAVPLRTPECTATERRGYSTFPIPNVLRCSRPALSGRRNARRLRGVATPGLAPKIGWQLGSASLSCTTYAS